MTGVGEAIDAVAAVPRFAASAFVVFALAFGVCALLTLPIINKWKNPR